MKKKIVCIFSMLLLAGGAFAQSYQYDNVSKAIEDMSKNPDYPKTYAKELEKFKSAFAKGTPSKAEQAKFDAFAREALLQNPLLQKNKDWVLIKRKKNLTTKGLPFNWQGNASLTLKSRDNDKGYVSKVKDELCTININNLDAGLTSLLSPTTAGITDVDVDWDASKLMYSSVNKKGSWQIYELDLKTKKTRLLTVEKWEDIDNYDGVYLQDGKIIYNSTACYAAVPCVGGRDYVANIYRMDPSSTDEDTRDSTIRQISFDQENSWSPTVFNDGKVMFTRWEYTDNSHYFSRILMQMNPDGSGQKAHYGSTSYWPNSLFYCRPIPEDANKFIAVVSGHHGVRRSGELHLFDVSKGVIEEEGRVHQYMGMGKKYVARMEDNLVGKLKMHFLHPYPLSENYIVASMQNKGGTPQDFSICLVDKFDNLTILHTEAGFDLMEPMPLSPREKPPLIADKVDEDSPFGYVFMNNVYEGPGLEGVKKGTVKKLRIFEYNYNYRGTGSHETIGFESCWDVKRVHGTVDVEEDGSAMFTLPANRPYSIQPLDADGKALALFRSWFTLRAGETQSCVGCHEPANTAPVTGTAIAGRKRPQNVQEFLGKARGFSFDREVQPVLDAYCVECHDGSNDLPNFKKVNQPWAEKNYSNSYLALHPYVRRPGPESNQNLLSPLEFHADTSELIQILNKGHKGVNMDDSSKRVLYTWIDLNVPYHGTLTEAYAVSDGGYASGAVPSKKGGKKGADPDDAGAVADDDATPAKTAKKGKKAKPIAAATTTAKKPTAKGGIPNGQEEKRRFFLKKYANRDYNYEIEDKDYNQAEHIKYNKRGKALTHKGAKTPSVSGFPFDAKLATDMQKKAGAKKEISIDIGAKKNMDLVLVPAGKYVQGSNNSFYDEGPALAAEVKKPFYMTKFEITNDLYRAFDKDHNSGFLDRHWKDHINPGYPANGDNMPVIRISYNEAQEFCKWLSAKLRVKVSLPTETQWEWAARAGSSKDFWYGNIGDDFSKSENFSDKQTTKFAVIGVNPQPMETSNRAPISEFYYYVPADRKYDDGNLLTSEVGKYKPNAFGLYDIAGNVAEWTDGSYTETLGGKVVAGKAVARGGSWADRPSFGKTTLRRPYSDWQKVYNVGFRVVIEADDAAKLK